MSVILRGTELPDISVIQMVGIQPYSAHQLLLYNWWLHNKCHSRKLMYSWKTVLGTIGLYRP